jgi:hypothetical protein
MQASVVLLAEFRATISVFLWTKMDSQWDVSDISRTLSKCQSCFTELSNSMELSTAWVATSCAATQQLHSILWNLVVYYHNHKSSLLAPILNQINQSKPPNLRYPKIYLNIINPPTSYSSEWSLSLWFSYNNL